MNPVQSWWQQFIHSFIIYLLSAFLKPGTVLGTGEQVSKDMLLLSWTLQRREDKHWVASQIMEILQPWQVLWRGGWSTVWTQNTEFVSAREASPRKWWFSYHLTAWKWVPLTMRWWFLFTIYLFFSYCIFHLQMFHLGFFFYVFYFSHNWVCVFL